MTLTRAVVLAAASAAGAALGYVLADRYVPFRGDGE